MIFFFVEILNRIRIHPIPYILVGLALSLFFVLLLSVSEVAGFDLAYLAASGATIALVSLYGASMFRVPRLGLLLGLLLLLQYGLLYFLLKQESYSLLIGSLGLFAALAAAMWFSRKIDWGTGQ
jgi:inner membrane protein